MLTFEDGEVTDVFTDSFSGDLCMDVRFKSFALRACFPKSEAARLIETVDEGTHIKFLTGSVRSKRVGIRFSLTDAKIVISEQ